VGTARLEASAAPSNNAPGHHVFPEANHSQQDELDVSTPDSGVVRIIESVSDLVEMMVRL